MKNPFKRSEKKVLNDPKVREMIKEDIKEAEGQAPPVPELTQQERQFLINLNEQFRVYLFTHGPGDFVNMPPAALEVEKNIKLYSLFGELIQVKTILIDLLAEMRGLRSDIKGGEEPGPEQEAENEQEMI